LVHTLRPLNFIGTTKRIANALNHIGHRVNGIQGLIGIHGRIRIVIRRDLPIRQINGFDTRFNLLHRLTACERAQSFFGNFLFSILMLYGIALSQAFSAGIIMSCIPVAVALLSRIFLKERIQRSTQWALLLAVSGLLILNTYSASPSSTDESSASLLGHICLLGAVFCEAMYVVIGRTLSQVIQPKRITAVINLWGLILITPLALMAIQQTGIPHVDASLWWLLLFYGLAASVGTVWG
jgi:hypothetical protein